MSSWIYENPDVTPEDNGYGGNPGRHLNDVVGMRRALSWGYPEDGTSMLTYPAQGTLVHLLVFGALALGLYKWFNDR